MNGRPGRSVVLVAGTTLQIALGSVYAWSFFQKPIMAAYGWNNAQTMWIFSLAICFLGLAAALGGLLLPRLGPRPLAVGGALLFGFGWILASVAMRARNLPLFYLAYGALGGVGLGFGYVTPVATVAKWFPERKGLATGAVVMGFGLGALVMSKLLAPFLLRVTGDSLPSTFMLSGIVLGGIAAISGALLRNPPAAVPTGAAGVPPSDATSGSGAAGRDRGPGAFRLDGRFIALWFMFFAAITAGIMFIGLQSPLFQDLLSHAGSRADGAGLAAAGATLVAVSSLFNGLGRILWGAVSDRLGRVATFRLILGSMALALVAMALVDSPPAFFALVCYALLCYGGGFGTMPSTIGEIFGQEGMALRYGAMLTAWSAGGIAGPQLAAAFKDAGLSPTITFAAAAGLLAAGLAVSFAARWKPGAGATPAGAPGGS